MYIFYMPPYVFNLQKYICICAMDSVLVSETTTEKTILINLLSLLKTFTEMKCDAISNAHTYSQAYPYISYTFNGLVGQSSL